MDEKRRQLGINVCLKKPPHMAFLGNPGVGKTSTARILGKLLNNFGILPSNRVVEVQRTDLVGEYIGKTGPKTKVKIKEAEGGILFLFVDEAYQLMVPDSRNDFGKEALGEIMHAMKSGKLSIIFAGYVEPMKLVFNFNAGFRRRVTTCFVFDDFNCDELAQILHLKMNNGGLYSGYKLSPSCSISAIAELIQRETSKEQRENMNGGLIDQVLTKAKESLDERLDVGCVDMDTLTTITLDDLKASLALLQYNAHFDGILDNTSSVTRIKNHTGPGMGMLTSFTITNVSNSKVLPKKGSIKTYMVATMLQLFCVFLLVIHECGSLETGDHPT